MVDPSKKVPDLNCKVQDLLLEVVDLKQELSDLRSDGIRPNLTPSIYIGLQWDVWNRFVAGRASCSVDDQVGDATCGQEVGGVIR